MSPGETVIEKSTTSRVMSTGWMSDPLVPTTARGNVPAVSVGTVRTLEPRTPDDDGWGKDGARGARQSQGHVAGEAAHGCDIDLEQGIIANDHRQCRRGDRH